jgi:hypothetical protein
MDAAGFRSRALSFPGAYESEHMGHPDFRGPKGIFATLNEKETSGVLRLEPEMADALANANPVTFPKLNTWRGRKWIEVVLARADESEIEALLEKAWDLRASD